MMLKVSVIILLNIYIKVATAGIQQPTQIKPPIINGIDGDTPIVLPPIPVIKPPILPGIAGVKDGADDEESQQFAFNFTEIEETIRKANEGDLEARSFGGGALPLVDDFGRPIPGLCDLEKPFPQNCKPIRGELYGEEPPVNIPYCVRFVKCSN